MKRIVTLLVAALMALSFSTVVLAEEKKEEKGAEAKTEKKADKKAKKEVKKDAKKDEKKGGEAKPAAKGKKEVSGC